MAARAPAEPRGSPSALLKHSLERVSHVPGVLPRRALMLGWRPHGPYTHVTRDARFVVHDIAALFHVWRNTSDVDCALRVYTESLSATTGDAAPATLAPHDSLAEVFVTAAALGDIKLLHALFQQDLQSLGVQVDVARLMHVACVNGHRTTVEWLWGLNSLTLDMKIKNAVRISTGLSVAAIYEALVAGTRSALHELDGKRDEGLLAYIRSQLLLNAPFAAATATTARTTMPVPIKSPIRGVNGSKQDTKPSAGDSARLTRLQTRTNTPKSDRPTVNKRDSSVSSTDTMDLPRKATPATGGVAVRVFTVRALMSAIGAFIIDPHELVAPLLGALRSGNNRPCRLQAVRLAIIYGNLHNLQAACFVCKARASDLPLLLHFAACEGRLDMVRWLHSQFMDGIKCRPDTMAMTVRCGWAEIASCLHSNCPESAQTMSSAVWNDAARFGHVDVLRTCHKNRMSQSCSLSLLLNAIRAGHVNIVELLHQLDWGYDRSLAMCEATKHGQSRVVRWLYTEEAVSSGRLLQVLCLNVPTAEETVLYMLSVIDPTSALTTDCVVNNFKLICEKTIASTLITLLSLIPLNDNVLFGGLLAATTLARRCNVELLLQRWQPREPDQQDSVLRAAMASEDKAFVLWLIRESLFDSACLDRLFACALERQTAFMRDSVKSAIQGVPIDRIAMSVMQELYKRRQRERPRDSTAARPLWDGLEVERVILECFPQQAQPNLVAFLLESCAPLKPGEYEYERFIAQRNGIIRLHTGGEGSDDGDGTDEVDDGNDGTRFGNGEDMLNVPLRCTRRCMEGALKTPFAAVHAARTGNLNVLTYLSERGVLVSFIMKAVDAVAFVHRQQAVQRWVSSRRDAVAGLPSSWDVVVIGQTGNGRHLADHHDDHAHDTIQCDLFHEGVNATEQNQRLLEITAEAGSLSGVQYSLTCMSTHMTPVQLYKALIAAARSNNMVIIRAIYDRKQLSPIKIDALRKLGGVADVVAMETLLHVLREWDPDVRRQLESERETGMRLFGPTPILPKTRSHRRD